MALYPNSFNGQFKLQPGARGEKFKADLPGYRGNEDRINRSNIRLNTNEHDSPNIKYMFDDRLPVLFRYGYAYGYNQMVIPKGRLVAVQGNLRVDRYQTQSGENRTFTKVSSRSVQALDSNRGKSENPYVESHQGSQAGFEPSFEPTQGLDPNGFQAIDDDDIPF